MAADANPVGLSLEVAQEGYHVNARAKRKARGELVAQLRAKAQAEHDYRKALSVAFAKHRATGCPVGEAEIHGKADAAHYALARDMADAEAKGTAARLGELEGERATLRQLADWSREES